MSGAFVKHDQGKARLDLIPADAIWALGAVLTDGAAKYTDNNWLLGAKWSRYVGALLRHLFAWLRGERLDPETGFSHLWHALCCLVFLVTYEMRGVGEDDLYFHGDHLKEGRHESPIDTSQNPKSSESLERRSEHA